MELKEGFIKNDIGLIPKDWEIKNIGSICEIYGRIGFRGYTVKDIMPKEEGAITISPSNIQEGKMDFSRCTYISWFKYEESPEIKIYNGDILLVKTGSTFGKTAIIKDLYEKATINPQLVVLKNIKVDNVFLGYIMAYKVVQNQIKSTIVGGAIPTLSQQLVANYKIPLPPTKSEQTAIATVLSDADALISSLEKLIEKKRNIKQGAMQELLKPKKGWVVKKLGEIGECIIGLTYSPDNVKESGLLVLRSSNVQGNTLHYDNNVYVDIDVPEKLIVKENDILICVRNGSRDLIGKCALIKGKAIGETFGAFMSVFRSPFNEFVFGCFQSNVIKKQIDEHLGATINQITNKSLNSFEIPFPPPNEQDEIVNILRDMDNEIMSLEKKLSKSKMLKQGMMQELLTGKIRLV